MMRLSLKAGYKLADIVSDIYYFFARNDRENLQCNLRIALKTDDKKIINAHIKNIFRNFAKYLVDFLRFEKLDNDYILSHVKLEGKENLDKARAKGKGAIVLTAHIGNWELGGGVVASMGYPLYVIALDHKDKRINDLFLHQRASVDVKVIPIGAQIKSCFRVLKKNWLLAIVGDRDFTNHGIKIAFFGQPTVFPKGPAVFSLRTGAAIIPTFVIRTENDAFKIIFEEPLEIKPTGNEAEDIKAIMQSYIAVIEKYVRSFPDQWCAFKKVWENVNNS